MNDTYNIYLLNKNNKVLVKKCDEIVYASGISEIDQLNFELFNLIDLDNKSYGEHTRKMGYGLYAPNLKHKNEIGNYSDELLYIMRYRGCTGYLIKRMYYSKILRYLAFFSDNAMHRGMGTNIDIVEFSEILEDFVKFSGDNQTVIEDNF